VKTNLIDTSLGTYRAVTKLLQTTRCTSTAAESDNRYNVKQ